MCQIQEHLEAGLKICEEVTKEIEIQIADHIPEEKIDPCFVTKETLKGSNSCTNELLPDSFKSSENQVHLTGNKQDIQTDRSTEVGQIPAVKLRMSNLETEEEDLDDVSWFFMADVPLDTRQIDNLADTSSTWHGASGYFDVDVDDVVLNSMQVTSLKSGECEDTDEDKFEECFDDVPRVVKSNTFQTSACDGDSQKFQRAGPLIDSQTFQMTGPSIPANSMLPETLNKYSNTQEPVRWEVIRNQSPEDDDFDQCFCDIEMDSKKQKDLYPKSTQSMGEKAQESPKLLGKHLQNLSNVRSSHNKVKNSSRHFKTIESTVAELSGGNALWESRDLEVNHTSTEPEEQSLVAEMAPPTAGGNIKTQNTSIEKLNHLISKLKIKSSSSKTLSRSRHYQNLDSTVTELSGEHENYPLNTDENVSCRQLSDSTEPDRFSMKDKDVEISESSSLNQSTIQGTGYQSIARGLSHGCEDVMDAVLKVAIMQSPNEEALR